MGPMSFPVGNGRMWLFVALWDYTKGKQPRFRDGITHPSWISEGGKTLMDIVNVCIPTYYLKTQTHTFREQQYLGIY